MRAGLVPAAVVVLAGLAGPAAAEAGPPVDAAKLYAGKCAQCHGRTGKGASSYPKLEGREAAYLAEKIGTYRAGTRVGPNSALMIQAAKNLTDDEVAALAAFISETFR